jgi:hypothetical protein
MIFVYFCITRPTPLLLKIIVAVTILNYRFFVLSIFLVLKVVGPLLKRPLFLYLCVRLKSDLS